ncbi:unnamed protein product [Oikopleura dioica]|uniref:Uncharacterized protein n=1 Tax=Oikopleura dioica TaxID=34765 RepID=E4YMA0_OIKDI|nr:unnamed protein product [Oikopleura dioica]
MENGYTQFGGIGTSPDFTSEKTRKNGASRGISEGNFTEYDYIILLCNTRNKNTKLVDSRGKVNQRNYIVECRRQLRITRNVKLSQRVTVNPVKWLEEGLEFGTTEKYIEDNLKKHAKDGKMHGNDVELCNDLNQNGVKRNEPGGPEKFRLINTKNNINSFNRRRSEVFDKEINRKMRFTDAFKPDKDREKRGKSLLSYRDVVLNNCDIDKHIVGQRITKKLFREVRDRKPNMNSSSGNPKLYLYGNHDKPKERRQYETFDQKHAQYTHNVRNTQEVFPKNVEFSTAKQQRGKTEYWECNFKWVGRNGNRGAPRGPTQQGQQGPRFGAFVPGGNNGAEENWKTVAAIKADEEDGTYENFEEQIERDLSSYDGRQKVTMGGDGPDNKDYGGQINLERIPTFAIDKHDVKYAHWTVPTKAFPWGSFEQEVFVAEMAKTTFSKVKLMPRVMINDNNVKFSYVNWHPQPFGQGLFTRPIPITMNFEMIPDYETFWAGGEGMFKKMYDRKHPLIKLDDEWIPSPWFGSTWANHVLTYCSGMAFRDTCKSLGMDIQRRTKDYDCIEMSILVYRRKEEDSSYFEFNTKTDAATILNTDLVVGVRFADPWAYIIFIFFARPLMSRIEPMRYASNSEKYAAMFGLIDLCSETEDKAEFQLTMGAAKIITTLYKLYTLIQGVLKNICGNLVVIEQRKINYVGLFSIESMFTVESELLQMFKLDNEAFKHDMQRRTIAYTQSFQKAREGDRLHHMYNLLWCEKFKEKVGPPVSMKTTMINIMNKSIEERNAGVKGRTSVTTMGFVHTQKRVAHENLERRVKSLSEPEYLAKIGKVDEYKSHFNEQTKNAETIKEINKKLEETRKEMQELKEENNLLRSTLSKRSGHTLMDEDEVDFDEMGLSNSVKKPKMMEKNE